MMTRVPEPRKDYRIRKSWISQHAMPEWIAPQSDSSIKNAKKYLILKKMSDTRDQPGRSMHAEIEDL